MTALSLVVVAFFPSLVHAHVGTGGTDGLSHGIAHPFSGLDHLCAMIAVGIWAAQRGGRAVWLVPLSFVAVMMLGGLLGARRVEIPFVEAGIVLSVLVLGVMIAASARLPLTASVVIVALFALFHGHAHGTEMPESAAGLAYGIGFVAATALLHACGIGLGLLTKKYDKPIVARFAGGTIAACGIYLCFV
jgi:urease accessory protein